MSPHGLRAGVLHSRRRRGGDDRSLILHVKEKLVLLGRWCTNAAHLLKVVSSLSQTVPHLTQSTHIQFMELAEVWSDNVAHLIPVLPHNHAEVTCPCMVRGVVRHHCSH